MGIEVPYRLLPVVITLQGQGSTQTWSAMPAALTEYRGTTAIRVKVDLTYANQFRFITRSGGTGGVAGALLFAQYSTDESTWNYMDGAGSATSTVNATAMTPTNTTFVTSWGTLAAGAKADVFLRVAGSGGDGTTSPTTGYIALEVR